MSIRRVQTPEWETSTPFPSTTWTSANQAAERAYYLGWIAAIKCSNLILSVSSAGSSTICYGTQWTKQRHTLRRIRSSGKISSHQDFIQHVQFYNVHTHYSMSTLSNFSCKTFVQCCSVSTKIGFSPCYPRTPDITPRLSKVADAVIKPLLLVKKYYVCMKRFTQ